MITQIEIDGFKTFKDFKVELTPFQVIVGPNGSGKSNLFDALHLLSRLADTDIATAFQELRGDAYEVFTLLPDGKRTDRIRIAVEMLVDRKVQDSWGKQIELANRRLRYELEITRRIDEYGLERLYVTHESLKSILQAEDTWSKKYGLSFPDNEIGQGEGEPIPFIATEVDQKVAATIYLSIEEYPYSVRGRIEFPAQNAQRTVLSGVTSTLGFQHAFAAAEMLRSLKLLRLNPEVLRQPSSFNAPASLSYEGGNLAAKLARMQVEDKFAFHCISLDMANLVPGILAVHIDEDRGRNQYIISVKDAQERSFSGNVLSDGTLRLLALATLRNDLQFRGVLCLEEPENGVNPLHFSRMVRLLREMSTDLKDEQQLEEPLRQVLVTTHSPTLISQPDARDSLLLAYTVMRVEPQSSGNPSLEVTHMTPVIPAKTRIQFDGKDDENEDKAVEAYTIDEVKRYLNSESLEEARQELDEARNALNKG